MTHVYMHVCAVWGGMGLRNAGEMVPKMKLMARRMMSKSPYFALGLAIDDPPEIEDPAVEVPGKAERQGARARERSERGNSRE